MSWTMTAMHYCCLCSWLHALSWLMLVHADESMQYDMPSTMVGIGVMYQLLTVPTKGRRNFTLNLTRCICFLPQVVAAFLVIGPIPHVLVYCLGHELHTMHASCLCFCCPAILNVCNCVQEGGLVKVEVVIGAPQRGPYHVALRQANPGTFFAGILTTCVLNLNLA